MSYNLDDILDGNFESEFQDGFEAGMPEDYCLQEDRLADLPWCAPWYDSQSYAIEEWYKPDEMTAYEMGNAWAKSCVDSWLHFFSGAGNTITDEEKKDRSIKLGHITVILPISRSSYFHWYPREINPQPAYIELDPNEETLIVDWNAEVGNAVPMDVYNHRRFRWSIYPTTPLETVRDLMKEIAPLADRVVAGYSEDYDRNNSNLVGILNDDAQEASDEIDEILSRY